MTQAIPLPYLTPQPRKWTMSRFMVWGVGGIVLGGMGIAVLLPSLCRPRETANRVKCASNLRQIGQAITLFAQGHGGAFPPSLAALPATEDITSEVMVCPSSPDEKATGADTAAVIAALTAAETNAPEHQHCLSYVYVGQALTVKSVTDTTVVAYEHLENHDNDGTNVLFGDGHVEYFSKQAWLKVAEEARIFTKI